MKAIKENMDKSAKDIIQEKHNLEGDMRQVQTDSKSLCQESQLLNDTLANMKERQTQLRQELESQKLAFQTIEKEKD